MLVRYFYINILFFLVLLGYLFGRLAAIGNWGRVLATMMVVGTLGGNASHTNEFLPTGARG